MTNKHTCPKCGKKMESIENPNVITSYAAPTEDTYACDKCACSCPADMPKWKVVWEERREAIVKAECPEEAERMVREGKYNGTTNDAVTVLPYALPIGD